MQTTSAATTATPVIGAWSEALAKEAFSCMDVHLDLNMTMIRPLASFGIGFKNNNQFFLIVFQKITDCANYCPFK